MNKFIITFIFFLFPCLLSASSSTITFLPPITDKSVGYLISLFGTISDTAFNWNSAQSTQIMGQMFAVLNAAVLALGGIIVMYTLMVSTMNTAHEGQMLGQKWSSIWIPLRSTMGLALLIPNSFGYCTMQVFVMWVVLQGIGAADSVWNAALTYLNATGNLYSSANSISPAKDLFNNKGANTANQALNILVGQVCMLGLEKLLTNYKNAYNAQASSGSGPCSAAAKASYPFMNTFCSSTVPAFLYSIDTVAVQSQNPSAPQWTMLMPNFPLASPYAGLNGICGSFSWSALSGVTSGGSGSGFASGGTSSVNYGDPNATPGSPAWDAYEVQKNFLTSDVTRACNSQKSGTTIDGTMIGFFGEDNLFHYTAYRLGCACTIRGGGNSCCITGNPYVLDYCKTISAGVVSCNCWVAPRLTYFLNDSSSKFDGTKGGYSCVSCGASVPTSAASYTAAQALASPAYARAIALQLMYNSLSTSLATPIVDNAPVLASYTNSTATSPPAFVTKQFGIPYTEENTICDQYTDECTKWNLPAGLTGDALFKGTELSNAINAYNTLVNSTLRDILLTSNPIAKDIKAFIPNARKDGWIMAGSYFYNLLKLQEISNTATDPDRDPNMGFNFDPSVWAQSTLYPYQLVQAFGVDESTPLKVMKQIESLVDGTGIGGISLNPPNLSSYANIAAETRPDYSSTVFGLVTNSLLMQIPGQTGFVPINFGTHPNFTLSPTAPMTLTSLDARCNSSILTNISADCFARIIGVGIYNSVFIPIFNFLMGIFQTIIQSVVELFIFIPMEGMALIFEEQVTVINATTADPVVALAQMGINYINFSGDLWMQLVTMSISSALIPLIGVFIFALISMAMPLLMAWMGVMVSIGFTTAYYIPFLPYILFTFGSFAWILCVVEAMVAAPIVALGVTHPEGHDAFGKGESAIMILANIFLRPSMMIIGYLSGITLTYVGVNILNNGYQNAMSFLNAATTSSSAGVSSASTLISSQNTTAGASTSAVSAGFKGYTDWAGMYAYFFGILTYVSIYLTLVQKSFTLISSLPDKVLRWIGGNPESAGQESAQWAGDVQKQQEGAAKATSDSQGQMQKQMTAGAMKAVDGAKSMAGKMGGSKGEASAS